MLTNNVNKALDTQSLHGNGKEEAHSTKKDLRLLYSANLSEEIYRTLLAIQAVL